MKTRRPQSPGSSWSLKALKSLCYLYQILAVSGLHQRFCKLKKLFLIDKASAISNLLDTGNVKALPLLEGCHKISRIQKRIMISRIQPCKTSSQSLYMKCCPFSDIHYSRW